MNLVKRFGSGLYPSSVEHATASEAFTEAQRLASKPEYVGAIFVVYQPTHLVFKNQEGHLMSIPVDENGRISVGDAVQAGLVPLS